MLLSPDPQNCQAPARLSLLVCALCLLVLFVGGCGFQPLYGTSSQGAVDNATFQTIRIERIPDVEGVALRNHLIDRFYTDGYPQNPAYSLQVSPVKTTSLKLGIKKDNTASRAQLRVETRFLLRDLKDDNKIILTRPVLSVVSYNVLNSQYSTMITEEDAINRGLKEISEIITRQIALHFNRSQEGYVPPASDNLPVTNEDGTITDVETFEQDLLDNFNENSDP